MCSLFRGINDFNVTDVIRSVVFKNIKLLHEAKPRAVETQVKEDFSVSLRHTCQIIWKNDSSYYLLTLLVLIIMNVFYQEIKKKH